MKKCPHCGKIYSNNDFYCLKDNYQLIYYSDEEMYKDQHVGQHTFSSAKQLQQYKISQQYKQDLFCTKCNQIYRKTLSTHCGLCGTKLIPYSENIPKCPTCQSTDIQKISTTSKVVHGAAFGLFSKTARSQFKCNNCGYIW